MKKAAHIIRRPVLIVVVMILFMLALSLPIRVWADGGAEQSAPLSERLQARIDHLRAVRLGEIPRERYDGYGRYRCYWAWDGRFIGAWVY